jgi:hypothetical protein
MVDPNSTHGDFLLASMSYLANTSKIDAQIALFEIGTGGTSSKIMRSFLEENSSTKLYSFENSNEWVNVYKKKYKNHERHKIYFIHDENWELAIQDVLEKIPVGTKILAFIDSSPWESRITAFNTLAAAVDLFLIHDADYFPHNKIIGEENDPIKYAPRNTFYYGRLKLENLGSRNYDIFAKYWVEVFPMTPGYFTGPPTLIASNHLDVNEIPLPKKSMALSRSR